MMTRVTADRDTRSPGNTFLAKFDREGVGDGSSYYWISGVEACQKQVNQEKCQTRSLNGRLADAHHVLGALAFAATQAASDFHKVRCSAAGIACKEQQDFYVGHDGGYMIPTHSKMSQEMRIHFETLFNECGKNELVPVYLETDTPNFCLSEEVK